MDNKSEQQHFGRFTPPLFYTTDNNRNNSIKHNKGWLTSAFVFIDLIP